MPRVVFENKISLANLDFQLNLFVSIANNCDSFKVITRLPLKMSEGSSAVYEDLRFFSLTLISVLYKFAHSIVSLINFPLFNSILLLFSISKSTWVYNASN